MAPHSSALAWKIPWREEPGGLQSMGLLRVGTTEQLHFHFSLSCIGEGNGNPLQCSCLENPRGRRAWWASVYGVTQSRTQLKWLSSSRALIDHLNKHIYSWISFLSFKILTLPHSTPSGLNLLISSTSEMIYFLSFPIQFSLCLLFVKRNN